MYHVEQYQYRDVPCIEGRNFNVYKLNEEGFKNYFGKESHNVNYVSRINPKVFKQITGVTYDTIYQENQEIINQKQRTESCPQKKVIIEDSKVQEIPYQTNQQVLENTQNCQNNYIEQTQKEKEEPRFTQLKTNSYCAPVTRNIKKIKAARQNLFSPGSTFAQYHKRRGFKETFGYDKIKSFTSKADQYSHDIDDLKSDRLANEEFNSSHSGIFRIKRAYNGFTSYEIPRTIRNNQIKNAPGAFKTYTQPLMKSLSCACLRNKGTDDYDTLKKDNLDMKANLEHQTSQKFLALHKLPDILKMANSRKKVRNLKLNNSKILGEKYDPFTFISPPQNRNAVNWVGALFQH